MISKLNNTESDDEFKQMIKDYNNTTDLRKQGSFLVTTDSNPSGTINEPPRQPNQISSYNKSKFDVSAGNQHSIRQEAANLINNHSLKKNGSSKYRNDP